MILLSVLAVMLQLMAVKITLNVLLEMYPSLKTQASPMKGTKMELTDKQYFCYTNYTYDKEFYVMTTNASETGEWETCVFCNDPVTGIRDFESLVEQIRFSSQDEAKQNHTDILYKWNTLGVV